jgi:hypothetical protein
MASDLASPTFYVYVNGELFATTEETTIDIPVPLGRIVAVEVFDDAGTAPSAYFPSTVTLRWTGQGNEALFRIEKYEDSTWSTVGQVPARGVLGRWESPVLADNTVHQFRVVPVDGTGRDGIPKEFTGLMCRYPDAPRVSVSFGSGEFTIT